MIRKRLIEVIEKKKKGNQIAWITDIAELQNIVDELGRLANENHLLRQQVAELSLSMGGSM